MSLAVQEQKWQYTFIHKYVCLTLVSGHLRWTGLYPCKSAGMVMGAGREILITGSTEGLSHNCFARSRLLLGTSCWARWTTGQIYSDCNFMTFSEVYFSQEKNKPFLTPPAQAAATSIIERGRACLMLLTIFSIFLNSTDKMHVQWWWDFSVLNCRHW